MLALCKFVNLGNTHHIDEEHELYGNVKWQIFGFLLVLKKNVIFKVQDDHILFSAVTDDEAVANSADLHHVLSAIGEASIAETLALQEAIMQSQMPSVAGSGLYQ